MNNRSPFIPNIPTPQGHWSDPSQLFNMNMNPNASGGGSGSSSSSPTNGQLQLQSQLQVPFTAHQQMQFHQNPQHHHQQQQLYNVGFINTSPSTSLPSPGGIFTSDGWTTGANIPSSMPMTMNQVNSYSYQLSNSQINYQAQLQQHQQQLGAAAQVQVMNIVNQSGQRGMQLTLDTPHFVHFPVNLSPPSGMLSSMNSSTRSTGVAGSQFTTTPSYNSQRNSNSAVMSRSGSSNSNQFNSTNGGTGGSPCPSPGIPLSLADSRSMSGSMESLYVNPSSVSPDVSSRLSTSGGSNNNQASNMLNSTYLPFLNLNSRLGANHSFSPPSPPPSFVGRSPSSMSPYSGGSSTPSPTPQLQLINSGNMRSLLHSTSTAPSHFSNNFSQSSTPLPTFIQPSQSVSGGGNRIRPPQPSPSPSPSPSPALGNVPSLMGQQYFNSRSPQQAPPPPAHMLSRPSPTPGSYVPVSPNNRSTSTPGFHLQSSPPQTQSQQHQSKAPSPPPVKVKPPRKPRAPRKRKEKEPPMKPIPINPTPPMMASHLSMPNLSNSWSHVLDLPPHISPAHLTSSIPNRPSFIVQDQPQPGPVGVQGPTVPVPGLFQYPYGGMNTYNQPGITNVRASNPTNINSTPSQSVVRSSVIQSSSNTNTSSLASSGQGPGGINRQPTPLTVTASPQRAPQRRTSQPQAKVVTSISSTIVPSSSPPGKLSMLDYAMEKAGILSNSSVTHGLGSSRTDELFGEADIMKIVSEPLDHSSLSATGVTRVPGDFDLESELNRFYSPPSPNQTNKSTVSAAPVPPTTTASTVPSSQTVSPAKTPPKSTIGEKETQPPDDDDCQVVYSKISDQKKRRAVGPVRRCQPKKAAAAGQQIQLQSRPNITLSTVVSQSAQAVLARHAPKKTPVVVVAEPKMKSMVRAAYPNGRCVAVAPKTTVPIPPPRSTTASETPRPRTTATARKSTTPIPPPRGKRQPSPTFSSNKPSTNTRQTQRSKRAAIEEFAIYPSDEPQPKMTRQAARLLQIKQEDLSPVPSPAHSPSTSRSQKRVQIKLEPVENNPSIKMKLNLKEGTVKSMTSTCPPRRPGPKSKTIAPGTTHKTVTDEDDLLIVDEFLADSDDSYDPDGERDEASSESESEPGEPDQHNDDSDEEKHPTFRKKRSPSRRLKDDDEFPKLPEDIKVNVKVTKYCELTPTNNANLKKLSEETTTPHEEDVEMLSCALLDDSYGSPGDSFSTPSPPFKNCIESELEKIQSKAEVEVEPPMLFADKRPKFPTVELGSDDDVQDVDKVVETFKMPKPAVIIKGTKEDADKAVNKMRETLAQLTKFKLPFFGR